MAKGDTLFKVEGLDHLIRKLEKLDDPARVLNSVVRQSATEYQMDMIEQTPQSIKDSSQWGYTRRPLTLMAKGRTNSEGPRTVGGWVPPRKLADSIYQTGNTALSADGKYSIVRILSEGRGWVYPKKAKLLYIPLNAEGRSKKPGQNPKRMGLVYGKDYVYIKKARPFRGTGFLEKGEHEHQKLFLSAVATRIRDLLERKKAHG